MNTASKKYIWVFFGILVVVMIGTYFSHFIFDPQRIPHKSAASDFVTIRDTSGQVILETGIKIHKDDEYINENDIHYIITQVNGNEAVAEIKTEHKSPVQTDKAIDAASLFIPDRLLRPAFKDIKVAIYHTHTDESYTPTSGKASKPGNGDIFLVGQALKKHLEEPGIKVTHSKNTHDPHDINAYHRSRRTAVKLVKHGPDAIFDLHRDSAPRQAYLTTINGETVSRVMIVIGRSNPNMQVNLDYAKRVKAAADKIHPGLMRGIFMGKGDYNQDLYPTALLFEIGTEQVSLNEAQKGVKLLGDVIIAVLRKEDL